MGGCLIFKIQNKGITVFFARIYTLIREKDKGENGRGVCLQVLDFAKDR